MKLEMKLIDNQNGKYSIDNQGRVFSNIRNKYKKSSISKDGYEQVSLSNNKKYYIHRLVATAFIDNKENKETVNHKDGNKLNNNVSNLEWATKSENERHKYDVLGRGGRKVMLNEKVYNSISSLARYLNVSGSSINNVLWNKRKSVKGYTKKEIKYYGNK